MVQNGDVEGGGRLCDETLAPALAADLDGNFERLVRLYQHRLYAFALRLSNQAPEAEEIAQDAFVRAYRALKRYPAERVAAMALRPWLYRITLNVFRNRVRGRRITHVGGDAFADGSPLEPAADERARPEAVAERAEAERELAAQLAALPERYRVPVVLRHVEGLGYAEIAESLGQPVGTVKANVHRGIQRLRESLTQPAVT